jgi:hypothetical protein
VWYGMALYGTVWYGMVRYGVSDDSCMKTDCIFRLS